MPKRILITGLLILSIALFNGLIGAGPAEGNAEGLRREVLAAGSGPAAEVGDIVTIQLSGWLVDDAGSKGARFIDTEQLGQPIAFKLGTDRVMPAWNQTVAGMRVGGKRRVLVPSTQGYGAEGVEGLVPPNADLIFEIELLAVEKN
jgi:FKBP-type peptidyl-prolyl cis-trans isomerase FkpA